MSVRSGVPVVSVVRCERGYLVVVVVCVISRMRLVPVMLEESLKTTMMRAISVSETRACYCVRI